MKENKDHGNVGVLVGGGHDVQVVVLDESIRAILGADQRGQGAIFLLKKVGKFIPRHLLPYGPCRVS